jgi:CoA:oxalate CoA-transferase
VAGARPAGGPPLEGTTVVDLTQQLPGPYATFLLAELGARVIKVEPPAGDVGRVLDPPMFATVNAGKESVVVDLKRPEGRERLAGLIGEAEVFVEGFRPGVAARLGAGYDDVRVLRPGIVYCSISGFGPAGPYRDVPGHDVNYLGVAGGAAVTPPGRGGTEIGAPTVDLASGTTAALSIVAALMDARRTGLGRFLDVAMLDSAVAWTLVKPPTPADAGGAGVGEPAYAVLPAADGRPISFAVMEDKFWSALCAALGWDDWAEDPGLASHALRRRRGVEIRERLRAAIAARPRDEWLSRLGAAGVPAAPAHEPAAVAGDPQVAVRELFAAALDGGRPRLRAPLPAAIRRPDPGRAPALGEHTPHPVGEPER